MRRIANILSALLVGIVFLAGCTTNDPIEANAPGTIQVVGRVTQFDSKNVTTKTAKTSAENKVTNMEMFVFDSDGNLVIKEFLAQSNPLFIINRGLDEYSTHNQNKLTAAEIYIAANIPSDKRAAVDAVTSVSDLLAINLNVSASSITSVPDEGFPMLGKSQAVDLSSSADLAGTLIEIPIYCLYAKIVFAIDVKPTQVVDDATPQNFTLKNWTVYNIPDKVCYDRPDDGEQTVNATGTFLSEITSSTFTGNNPLFENGGKLTFSFYMPEHRIIPATLASDYQYPWLSLSDQSQYEDYRQHFKNLLPSDSQHPTYVKIVGSYYDHNQRQRDVTYTIYLGEDNWSNFFIDRDCQYNNYITIKGVTNTSTGDNISADHRVDIQQAEFKFAIERETLLDSHWEVRPIRITLDHDDHPDAKIEVELMSDVDWLRMELPTTLTSNHIQEGISTGKRKYFTTNLLSSLNAAENKKVTILSTDGQSEYCIWVYIDEYTSTSAGNVYRDAAVQTRYFDHKADGTPTVEETYLFRQKNIYKVTHNNDYFIEYYEEYLYNFDAKDEYGNTTDGMEWGLDGVELSKTYDAIMMGDATISGSNAWGNMFNNYYQNSYKSVVSNISSQYGAKYDFYLQRDKDNLANSSSITARDQSGLDFTKEIAATAIANAPSLFPAVRASDQTVQSAVEYCYNKNKRDDNGRVSTVHWYLPAIDEIEDITIGGYTTFDVFQDKLYWSSQPSYKEYAVTFRGTYNYLFDTGKVSADGAYYKDHTGRARSTKIKLNANGEWVNEESGVTGSWGTLEATQSGTNASVKYNLIENGDSGVTYDPGNRPRSGEIHRVRCAYK